MQPHLWVWLLGAPFILGMIDLIITSKSQAA